MWRTCGRPPTQRWADESAVLLPPEPVGEMVKMPNTTRERYGDWTIFGGVYLVEPTFATNPAFVVQNAAAPARTRSI